MRSCLRRHLNRIQIKRHTRRHYCYSVGGRGSEYISNTYNHIPTASFKSTICFSSITAGLLSRCWNGYREKGGEKERVCPPGLGMIKKSNFLSISILLIFFESFLVCVMLGTKQPLKCIYSGNSSGASHNSVCLVELLRQKEGKHSTQTAGWVRAARRLPEEEMLELSLER